MSWAQGLGLFDVVSEADFFVIQVAISGMSVVGAVKTEEANTFGFALQIFQHDKFLGSHRRPFGALRRFRREYHDLRVGLPVITQSMR